jgi:hypothetical protein
MRRVGVGVITGVSELVRRRRWSRESLVPPPPAFAGTSPTRGEEC